MSILLSSQASEMSFSSPSSEHSYSSLSSEIVPVPSLSAVDWHRHKQLLGQYLLYHTRLFTDPQSIEALSLYTANADNASHPITRAATISKYYYDRLTREYAVTDLSLYKLGKIGLRWRTPTEILHGKGQFICSSKDCTQFNHLISMELEFFYHEKKELKKSLVQVRVCSVCAEQINYRKKKSSGGSSLKSVNQSENQGSSMESSISGVKATMNGAMKRKFSLRSSEEDGLNPIRRRIEDETNEREKENDESGSLSPTVGDPLFPDASYQSPSKRSLSPGSASSPGSPSDFAVPPPRLPRIRTPEQQANLERKRTLERERSISPHSAGSLSPEPEPESNSNSLPPFATINADADLAHQ